MSSWRSRCLQPLVDGADQPRRTAAAFALGVFLSFSPLLGLQIAASVALAYALRLSRPAVLIGVCVNLPWLVVPWYTLTTLAGARILGLKLPSDLTSRLAALADLPFLTRAFWARAVELLAPFLGAFLLGSFAGACIVAIVAYLVASRFLERIRLSRLAA